MEEPPESGLPCKGCSDAMFGVRDYDIREICEECGGNITEYNNLNPHPEKTK